MVRTTTGAPEGRSRSRTRRLAFAMALTLAGAKLPDIIAQVAGGQVVAGNASVQQEGLLTTIRAGDQSVLRWDRFNIGAPETVQFIQPGADSRVLNYIGGAAPSAIDGRLLANGQVYLMNPYGIYFGRTAVVETAGLFAVAGQMSKEDFLSGLNRFTGLQGAVVNDGAISARAVALIGQTVANTGSIVAPDGFVGLAAGDETLVGERGGRVFVKVGKTAPPADPNRTGVSNTGSISAPRGRVVLAAGDLFSMAISNDGIVAGRDVSMQGQGSGVVVNSGRVDASVSQSGGTGGRIEITGEKVGMMAGAVADASGSAGGGTILVGGDFQGGNAAVRNAAVTYVGPGAELRADATAEGDGGKVIIWSDDTTRYYGALSAQGAGADGAGGLAEISGLKLLDFQGAADLRASGGRTGTLLLDPTNIFVAGNLASATAAGMLGGDMSASGGTFTASGTVRDSLVLTADLTGALASANVVITTTNPTGTGLGNITVVDQFFWSSMRSLGLTAANNIVVIGDITNAGGADVTLSAGGTVSVGSAGIRAGNVTIAHAGMLSGTGTIAGTTSITLTGAGAVGAAGTGNAVGLNTPALTVNKPAGAVFVNNGSNPLILRATGLPAGGEITAGDLTLAADINAGSNPLRLTTGALWLQGFDINAGTLTLNNAGVLRGFGGEESDGPGSLNANSITFGGSGDVGTYYDRILTKAATLTFAKTARAAGGAWMEIENRRSGGVTVSGTLAGNGATLKLISRNAAGAADEAVSVAASSLSAPGASSDLWLKGSAVTLSGGIAGSYVEIENSGALTGTGTIAAPIGVFFSSSGAVGAAGPAGAIRINTPRLSLGKPAGAVFASNGTNPLLLSTYSEETAEILNGGGEITAGNLTIDVPINAGGNALALNTAALTLSLGDSWEGDHIVAGNLTVNNSGPFTGTGPIRATNLTLGGAGAVGNATRPLPTRATSLTFVKSGGATFITNSGALAVSGSVANGDANIWSSGALTVGANLGVGTGTVRLVATGGVSQGAGTIITAGTLGVLNRGTGHIALNGVNAVGTLAAANVVGGGTATVRSDMTTSLTIGSVPAAGETFPLVTGVITGNPIGTLAGGNITLNNTVGNIVVNQPVTIVGTGAGTINIMGAVTINSPVFASAGTTASITGRAVPVTPVTPTVPPVAVDTIINVPLTTGNVSISALRDVIVNAPVTVTSAGGLSIAADMDNNGSGGVLFTSAGTLTAGSLGAPLNITGSSLVNVGNIGGPSLGAGSVFYMQSGGAISTVQPVNITAQSSAPASAGFVINGSAARPAIATTGGGISFTGSSAGAITLNGGSLESSLLSASGSVAFGSRPLTLAGNTRVAAPSAVFDGNVNGASGLALSGAATFGGVVGGSAPLALLQVDGPATVNANITTSGEQRYNGSITGAGILASGTAIHFAGAGAVGGTGSGNAINIRTPALTVNKSAGAVFASNGGSALALTTTAIPGGGELTAGDLTLLAPLNAGTNAVTINTAGTLALGANEITAENLTLNHAGAISGAGTLVAGNLALHGNGDVGSAGNLIQTRSTGLTLGKTAGNTFVSNAGALSLSGTVANADVNISVAGPLSVTGNISVGTGALRLVTSGGVSQAENSTIAAGKLAVLNHTAGDINLGGANVIGEFAGENAFGTGLLAIRSDVAMGSTVGAVAGAGPEFPAVSGVTTQGGNLSITNTTGGITVNEAARSRGDGTGSVRISGTTVNASVAAAAGTTVAITGSSIVLADTIINSPLVTGDAIISATRDVIVNAPLTATSTGGLAVTADSDNNGIGGVLVTGAGSLIASSLTAPLIISGSALVSEGAAVLSETGAEKLLYIQTGGTIRTVQPVTVAAQSNAPATAGIVLNGNGTSPAILTTGGGITFAIPSAGSITLNGGSLANPLLSATGALAFGPQPITLAGNTRLSAPSTTFGGTVNGGFGLSLGGAVTLGSAVGGAAPLASVMVDGTTMTSANVTTTGTQTYRGAVTLNADTTFATSNSSVLFGSTLNSAGAAPRNLTVNAGSGAMTATGAAGGVNPLGALVINSTGTTTLAGVTAGSLTTNAGGTSVIGGPVTAGTVTINDPLTVGGSGVSTTASQTYASSVQLRANARFASSGGSVVFGSTVFPDTQNAARTFEAVAPNGSVTVAGGLGAEANRFGSVLVTGRNAFVTDVFTSGALGLAMGTGATDELEISGSRISSSNGTVTLGSAPGKTAAPMRASINKGNAGNLTIDGNQVIFQPYERTSVSAGDLVVTGRTSATLSTTAVSGHLIVTAPSLAIYQRAPAPVDLASGSGMDSGVDIVATSVDFAMARDAATGRATIPFSGIPSPSAFSTISLGSAANSGRIAVATLIPPVNAPDWPSMQYLDLRGAGFSGESIETARFGTTAPLLSLVAAGRAAATAGQTVANVLPPVLAQAVIRVEDSSRAEEDDRDGPAVPIEKLRPLLVDVELSAALREQLQNLGIFARPLNDEERAARLRNLPFYDQVPRQSSARDRDYQVVDARISKESAIAAVAEWERQFLQPDTRQSRVLDIASALAKTFDAYRDTNSAIDPAGFRAWLESRPTDSAAALALRFVREVGSLFRQIELLGLTNAELEVAKAQILFRVLQDAPSMRAGFLRRVIDAGAATAATTPPPAAQRSAATTEDPDSGPKV